MHFKSVVAILLVALFVGCAQGRRSRSASSGSSLAPAIGAWGVSAPTSISTATTVTWIDNWRGHLLSWLDWIPFAVHSRVVKAAATDLPTFAALKDIIEQTLGKASSDDCVADSFSFSQSLPTFTCFGAPLTYQNHPDGADGANCNAISYPCTTLDDVGIVAAGEAVEACSAVKINHVVKSIGDIINTSSRTLGGFLCSVGIAGGSPPDAGSSLDLKSVVNSAVSNADFSSASIRGLDAREGAEATYETLLDGTVSGNRILIDLIHSPTNSDNTAFMGHMHGMIEFGEGSVMAFSLIYNQDSDGILSSAIRAGLANSKDDEVFDSNNDLDYSVDSFDDNPIYYHRFRVDVSNNVGTSYTAFQAAGSETSSRVFQVTTAAASPQTAVSYFGHGAALTGGSRGIISKFVCNFAGPGFNHTGLSNKAQSQTMTRDSDGYFTAGTSHITYMPVNSCDYNGAGAFKVGTYPAAPLPPGAVSNNLDAFNGTTGVGAAGNITVIAEPTTY